MKHFLNYKILFIFIIIFFSNTTGSEAMKLRQDNLQRFKEKFDIQFTLYNGETLPNLIPSVEGKMVQDEKVLKVLKYIYISALYNGTGAAYLTVDIKSQNNPSLNLEEYHMRLDGGIRQYELVYFGGILMRTGDPEAIIDYEIKDVWFK